MKILFIILSFGLFTLPAQGASEESKKIAREMFDYIGKKINKKVWEKKHPDGSIETKWKATGNISRKYPDRLVRKRPSGSVTTFFYSNHPRRGTQETKYPDGRVVTTYNANYPGKLKDHIVTKYPDGREKIVYPKGFNKFFETKDSKGTTRTYYRKGKGLDKQFEVKYSNGQVMTKYSSGPLKDHIVTKYPDGQVMTMNPDGTFKTVDPSDGKATRTVAGGVIDDSGPTKAKRFVGTGGGGKKSSLAMERDKWKKEAELYKNDYLNCKRNLARYITPKPMPVGPTTQGLGMFTTYQPPVSIPPPVSKGGGAIQ